METITLTKEELLEAIRDYLMQNTTIIGVYNGGGDEPQYLAFDQEFDYVKNKVEPVDIFSERMTDSIFDSQVVNKQ